jgi:hypothetical protein
MDLGEGDVEPSGAGRGTEPLRQRDAVVLAAADCSDRQRL